MIARCRYQWMGRLPWMGCLALALAWMLAPGCDRKAPDLSALEIKPRFVSYSPALSQMIVELGLGDLLVGVARNDDAAPKDLPIVGDLFEPNIEALLATRPTMVFMMVGKEGPPGRLVELANQKKFTLITYPTPQSINELGNILIDDTEMLNILAPAPGTPAPGTPAPGTPGSPGGNIPSAVDGAGREDAAAVTQPKASPSLGVVLGLPMKAYKLKYDMLNRLAQISEATSAGKRQRVLLVLNAGEVAADLPMACGPGTVHDQLLGFLNASNAAIDASVYAPVFDREKLLAIAPQVILLLSPKGRPLGTIDQDVRLSAYKGLNIPAVTNQRIVLIDDPLTLLPSTSLPRIGALMAKAIHPELSAQIDAAMKADLTIAHSQPASQPEPELIPVPVPIPPVPHAR